MALLSPAPTQNFELILDRIGEILVDELSNQSVNPVVFKERIIPFDKTDLEAVNVALAQGDFTSKTVVDRDGEYQYNIDCYVSSKSSTTDRADKLANLKLQKLMGVVGYILSASQYISLLFPKPFIKHTMVRSMRFADTGNNHDAITTVMGRIEFMVHANENSAIVSGVDFVENITTVKLNETNKGYIWIKK